MSKANKDYGYYLKQLNNIFEKDFATVSKKFTRNKRGFVKYKKEIYEKWLISVVGKDYSLTPIIILSGLPDSKNLFPSFRSLDSSKINNAPLNYSLENHPIVNDLKTILNSSLTYDLENQMDLNDKNVQKLLTKLSICDVEYLEFLKITCLNIGLLKSVPSIHCQKLVISQDAKKILDYAPAKIFDLVVKSTIKNFYSSLSASLGLEKNDDYNLVISFIKCIFKCCGEPAGKVINEILMHFDITKDSFIKSDTHDYFQECIYFINVSLNRFFFLPMWRYLRLLMPISPQPLNLEIMFNYINNYIDMNVDVYNLFDFGDSKFIFTDIGKKYFEDIDAGKSEKIKINYPTSSELATRLSLEEIDYLVPNMKKIVPQDYPAQLNLISYQLRLEIDGYPKHWRTVECTGQMSLNEFFLMVCNQFCFDTNSPYSFRNPNNTESEQPQFIRSHNQKLNDLNIDTGQTFFLDVHNQFNHYARKNKKIILAYVSVKISVLEKVLSPKNILLQSRLIRSSFLK